MMVSQIPVEAVLETEMLPQAIIARSPQYLAAERGIKFRKFHDDFDDAEVAALVTKDGVRYLLKHYMGYPPDTTTIYLAYDITYVPKITALVEVIFDELEIPKEWLLWQRADNPEL